MAATASPYLDVLIIGGGPAGLAVATGLARQLYTALVFDSGVYRNDATKHMHNFPGWDHRDPADFRKTAREDILRRYSTIQFRNTSVNSVAKTSNGLFRVTDAQGKEWLGRKLALAMGVRDVYPDIDGYGDCWGRGIYHCLFCHGYEDKGCASAGVLAIGNIASTGVAMHLALMAKRLTPNVTIYTDGAEELSEQLTQGKGVTGLKIHKTPITRLEKSQGESEVTLHFSDGSSITEGFLVHRPKTEINGPFARDLGLELTESGDIKVSQPFCESSVKGVFAVGDCATPLQAVSQAVAMGGFSAGGLVTQLQFEPAPKL